jgi:hypothetical protein
MRDGLDLNSQVLQSLTIWSLEVFNQNVIKFFIFIGRIFILEHVNFKLSTSR